MKQLILIRHAKSSWDFQYKDFDRPILAVGIERSVKVARQFLEFLPQKACFYASAAQRTKDTAAIFAQEWGIDVKAIRFEDSLYTFEVSKLEHFIKSISNDCKTAILFGHNNAITDFVNKFGTIFVDNVPTSGLVLINFDVESWALITKGKTDKILFPRTI